MGTVSATKETAIRGAEPISQLLTRASAELRDMASVTDDLEALVGNLVLAGSFGTSNSIYDLQKLDLLRQSIAGIADFLDGICRSSHPGWTVDSNSAAETVKLAGLSERLRGAAAQEDYVADSFELFGDDLSKVA